MSKLGKTAIILFGMAGLCSLGVFLYIVFIIQSVPGPQGNTVTEVQKRFEDSECFKTMKAAKGQTKYIDDLGTRMIALDRPVEACETVEDFLRANAMAGNVVQEVMRQEDINPTNVLINRCGPDSPVPVKGQVCKDLERIQEEQK